MGHATENAVAWSNFSLLGLISRVLYLTGGETHLFIPISHRTVPLGLSVRAPSLSSAHFQPLPRILPYTRFCRKFPLKYDQVQIPPRWRGSEAKLWRTRRRRTDQTQVAERPTTYRKNGGCWRVRHTDNDHTNRNETTYCSRESGCYLSGRRYWNVLDLCGAREVLLGLGM